MPEPLDIPLVFEPYFRAQVWGGRRLQERLGKRLPLDGRFGESWEISAHEHHVSRVAEGPLQSTPLSDLWRERGGELVGQGSKIASKFPLLIKYLDCHELLSVQVHPTDELARELIGDESGKTEAWVIIEAEPTARIYAGLRPGVTRDVLQKHLDAGTVAECLHSFVPRAGDCVFLPAGTVHAVGGGVLMAEVQQTSDATFRLFDASCTSRNRSSRSTGPPDPCNPSRRSRWRACRPASKVSDWWLATTFRWIATGCAALCRCRIRASFRSGSFWRARPNCRAGRRDTGGSSAAGKRCWCPLRPVA
jgi:hypothetical protein